MVSAQIDWKMRFRLLNFVPHTLFPVNSYGFKHFVFHNFFKKTFVLLTCDLSCLKRFHMVVFGSIGVPSTL